MTRQKRLGFFGVMAVAAVVATMTAACGQTDAGITTAVKSKLVADDTVKAYRIDVDTKDKVVTLKGDVDSRAARDRAVELARATDGVREVVDVMVLAPAPAPTSGVADQAKEASRDAGQMIGDAGITTAVKAKMLADTTVSGLKIDVDTKDGVVALIGNVGSAAEKRRALEIARETDGVKSVRDDLKIVPKK
jgi:hyperosmotically inducible periplasmic protein